MATYRDAGVDLAAADEVVEAIRDTVVSTWGPNVVGSFGGFAGGLRIPPGYTDPVLMMSTDGVGTKLDLARRHDRLEGVGFDLVAMVVDDLAAAGARPLAITDYIAVGRLKPRQVERVIASVAAACRQAEVALVGGETAEHPGTMPDDAIDVSATALGVVDGNDLLDHNDVVDGDVVIGVLSPNLRSNGFSLVRSTLANQLNDDLDGRLVIDHLLDPSVIYSPAAVAARPHVKSFAHITGGGIGANLVRALPGGLGASLDDSLWPRPAIFDLIASSGVAPDEMRRVFNMGIGFMAICAPDLVTDVVASFETGGHRASVVGTVRRDVAGVVYESSTTPG